MIHFKTILYDGFRPNNIKYYFYNDKTDQYYVYHFTKSRFYIYSYDYECYRYTIRCSKVINLNENILDNLSIEEYTVKPDLNLIFSKHNKIHKRLYKILKLL